MTSVEQLYWPDLHCLPDRKFHLLGIYIDPVVLNEMSHNLEELLTWKREMTKQHFEEDDKYIKIETNVEEDDEETINNKQRVHRNRN